MPALPQSQPATADHASSLLPSGRGAVDSIAQRNHAAPTSARSSEPGMSDIVRSIEAPSLSTSRGDGARHGVPSTSRGSAALGSSVARGFPACRCPAQSDRCAWTRPPMLGRLTPWIGAAGCQMVHRTDSSCSGSALGTTGLIPSDQTAACSRRTTSTDRAHRRARLHRPRAHAASTSSRADAPHSGAHHRVRSGSKRQAGTG